MFLCEMVEWCEFMFFMWFYILVLVVLLWWCIDESWLVCELGEL